MVKVCGIDKLVVSLSLYKFNVHQHSMHKCSRQCQILTNLQLPALFLGRATVDDPLPYFFLVAVLPASGL